MTQSWLKLWNFNEKFRYIFRIVLRIQLLYNTFQVRFFWPQQQLKEDGLMMEKEAFEAKKDDTAYMSDELGQGIFTYIFEGYI